MQTYQRKQRAVSQMPKTARKTTAQAPPMDALRSVGSLSAIEQHSHPVDLPSVLRAKMENAFGADLSGVRLYESQSVADAGAEALTQGGHIAFAPGRLDFTSMQGQSLLGHELSHVVSQARGEARGRGLLEDHSLEARADREGTMAAMGQSIFPATDAAPVAAPAAAMGPVQAKWTLPWKRKKKDATEEKKAEPEAQPTAAPRLGEDQIEADSLGDHIGNAIDMATAVPDQIDDTQGMLETLGSKAHGKYILGQSGKLADQAAGATKDFSESKPVTYGKLAAGTIGTVKGTIDAARDIKNTIQDENMNTAQKGMAIGSTATNWVADTTQTANDFTDEFISNDTLKDAVGDQLGAASTAAKMVNTTIGTAQELYDIHNDDYKDKGDKVLAGSKAATNWGSTMVKGSRQFTNAFISNPVIKAAVGSGLKYAGAALDITKGGIEMGQAIKEGHDADSDRMSAERVGRQLKAEQEQRQLEAAQTGNTAMLDHDKLLRNMATNTRNTAKIHKTQSIQKGVNAGMDMVNAGLSLIPEGGELAALAGSGIQQVVNAGMNAHIHQKQKRAREANLDNLSVRANIEERLGIQNAKSESEKDVIRHRAKHIANQYASGTRGAKTSKVAAMHKTSNDLDQLNTLVSQNDAEGNRARMLAANMGIGSDENGLYNKDRAGSHINSDFAEGNSMEDTMNSADAHQFAKEHTVEAELKRQEARRNAKAEEGTAKAAKKEKEAQAKANYAAKTPEEKAEIEAKKKARKNRADAEIKASGIKWYEFSKKKAIRLRVDIDEGAGDEYGGNDTTDKEAELMELQNKQRQKEQQKADKIKQKANNKLDAATRKTARKEARAENKRYQQERNQARKDAGIKWYQFGKKKAFNEQYDIDSGTKEAVDPNAPEGSATANAKLPWYKKMAKGVQNKYFSMKRKHERARDSFVNEKESFNKLSGWRKAKLIAKNPLAYIGSKTQSGKAKAAQHKAQEAENEAILNELMPSEQQAEDTNQAPEAEQPEEETNEPEESEEPAEENKAPEAEDSVDGNNAPESNEEVLENQMSPESALEEEEKRKQKL